MEQQYISIWKEALILDYTRFLSQLRDVFGIEPPLDFIHDLALTTQICIKPSKPLYVHGFVLYCALRKYCDEHRHEQPFLIVETGTSRGFSAICMAKALSDAGVEGKIITFDINLTINLKPGEQLDVKTNKIMWNCIRDARGPSTRYELLEKWSDLVNKYVDFIDGDSKRTLPEFLSTVSRVHFAFLDANHSYETVNREINQVYPLQLVGDVIVCDDYTQEQFPGIIKAVDQHISMYTPETHKFFFPHGPKREWLRGYVHMSKSTSIS